ncbi:MAG: phosphoribosyltransferase family protein [Elusimicrobiales bacterium]
MTRELFADRKDAATRLLQIMAANGVRLKNPIVAAIPRGGVAIGYYVARSLQAPLETLAVKKLSSPNNPEFGFGAVAGGRTVALNTALVEELNISADDVSRAIDNAGAEVLRMTDIYRGAAPVHDIAGRDVVVADDGIATSYTMLAAVRWLRGRNPASITAVAPVAHAGALKLVRREADAVFAAVTEDTASLDVSRRYVNFSRLDDEDVLGYLEKSRCNALRETAAV